MDQICGDTETRCLHYFWPPYLCSSEEHKYGIPILSPINFCYILKSNSEMENCAGVRLGLVFNLSIFWNLKLLASDIPWFWFKFLIALQWKPPIEYYSCVTCKTHRPFPAVVQTCRCKCWKNCLGPQGYWNTSLVNTNCFVKQMRVYTYYLKAEIGERSLLFHRQ